MSGLELAVYQVCLIIVVCPPGKRVYHPPLRKIAPVIKKHNQ
jgi:hypothetical protein